MLLSAVYDKLIDERLVEEVAPIEGGGGTGGRDRGPTPQRTAAAGAPYVCAGGVTTTHPWPVVWQKVKQVNRGEASTPKHN